MNRRDAVKLVTAAAGAAALAPFINRGRYRLWASSPVQYSARCITLMQEATVLDMLGVLSISNQWQGWARQPETFTEADFQRYRSSGINVFHHAFGLGGYQSVVNFCNSVNGLVSGAGTYFTRIDSAEHLKTIKSSGKIGLLIGVQNSSHFRTVEDVNHFHGQGQRVSQLTYNATTPIGSGSTAPTDAGVTEYGTQVIARMNAVGMAIDVSHCGDRTTLDAFTHSKHPVLITHSNCRALTPGHPRCKSDEAILAVGKAGSVMGITGVRNFVKGTEPTTVDDVIAHFNHVKKLIGAEHVGVGSDMDLYGYDALPPEQLKQMKAGYAGTYAFRDKVDIEGLDHPKRMFDLTEGLIRHKYSDQEIHGILGGNFVRVLSDIWRK